MSTFKVGETAIGVCHDGRYDPDGYHGAEVTIIGGLAEREMGIGRRACYLCQRGSQTRHALPEWLRKKPPMYDGNTATRWADCPWHPAAMVLGWRLYT